MRSITPSWQYAQQRALNRHQRQALRRLFSEVVEHGVTIEATFNQVAGVIGYPQGDKAHWEVIAWRFKGTVSAARGEPHRDPERLCLWQVKAASREEALIIADSLSQAIEDQEPLSADDSQPPPRSQV